MIVAAVRAAVVFSCAVFLSLTATGARAADDLGPPPSDALQCLAPPAAERVAPVYPPSMLESKQGGHLSVELRFDGPRSAPSLKFLTEGLDPFERAIEDYAKPLRVPCMAPGAAPVTLRQEFDFVPNDGRKVAWTLPSDPSPADGLSHAACRVDFAAQDYQKPLYPRELISRAVEGTVVTQLRFTDPAEPPQITVLDDAGYPALARSVVSSFRTLRATCPAGAAMPFETRIQYRFIIDGAVDRVVLKDMSLPKFLGFAKPFARGGIYFDTNLMKCPFDVRLTARQPWNRNKIDELDEDIPARHAFLSWLSSLELNLTPHQANAVLGQQVVISVPCVKIDL